MTQYHKKQSRVVIETKKSKEVGFILVKYEGEKEFTKIIESELNIISNAEYREKVLSDRRNKSGKHFIRAARTDKNESIPINK